MNTNDLLDQAVQQIEPHAVEKGLTVIRAYADLPALWVDEGRMRQILANLLSNAVRFTERATSSCAAMSSRTRAGWS